MVCGYSRKEIQCELLGIFALFHVNHNFSDEVSLYFCRLGYICHFFVAKYLNTATFKTSTKFYNNTFPYDMIFAKADASTNDEQIKNLTRELNIHYRACL